MNVDSLIKEWEYDQKFDRYEFIELDLEKKAVVVPDDGWEIVDVDPENFDEAVQKLTMNDTSLLRSPKTVTETSLNMEHPEKWYGKDAAMSMWLEKGSEIVKEFMFNTLATGTGKFIKKKGNKGKK